MPVKEFVVTLSIGGAGGFVCPFTTVLIDREVVTIRPPLVVRWLVRTREVTAEQTKVIELGPASVTLEKRNGMAYKLGSSEANAIMRAFNDAGFPMVWS